MKSGLKAFQHHSYDEHRVILQLNQKNDIIVKAIDSTVNVLTGTKHKGDIGIKSKGKTDFLVKYCGYRLVFTRSFT